MTQGRQDLVDEMIRRTTEAGDAAGIYLLAAGVMMGPNGPTEPLQVVARFAVGERAFLVPADTEAIRRRRVETELLERALEPTAAELRAEFEAGPLGEGKA